MVVSPWPIPGGRLGVSASGVILFEVIRILASSGATSLPWFTGPLGRAASGRRIVPQRAGARPVANRVQLAADLGHAEHQSGQSETPLLSCRWVDPWWRNRRAVRVRPATCRPFLVGYRHRPGDIRSTAGARRGRRTSQPLPPGSSRWPHWATSVSMPRTRARISAGKAPRLETKFARVPL
jgi:hypothetical protein